MDRRAQIQQARQHMERALDSMAAEIERHAALVRRMERVLAKEEPGDPEAIVRESEVQLILIDISRAECASLAEAYERLQGDVRSERTG